MLKKQEELVHMHDELVNTREELEQELVTAQAEASIAMESYQKTPDFVKISEKVLLESSHQGV